MKSSYKRAFLLKPTMVFAVRLIKRKASRFLYETEIVTLVVT
ncbi:hypothetical protein [Rivularia sp. PCC 7116]|nr:hypothetical protein [Rivularia sp. PCC 7116]